MTRESEAVVHEAAQIRALAEELAAGAKKFDRRIAEFRRGGLPSSSMGGSSRGAETPLPLPDRIDQFLLQQRKMRRQSVSEALGAIQRAVQAQRSVVLTEAEYTKPAIPCANIQCGELLEEGRQSGECGRCRVHRHRHGMAYPLMEETA